MAVKKYKFKAVIKSSAVGKGGAAVEFPYDVESEFGTRGNVPVQATIDGEPYRGSLMNCGMAHHALGVLKGVREKIGNGPGDSVDVVVWKDEEVRTVEVPAEFERLLKKEKLWDALRSSATRTAKSTFAGLPKPRRKRRGRRGWPRPWQCLKRA